jgi:hypothetical protein
VVAHGIDPGGDLLADSSEDWKVAINACPYCGAAMPEHTEADYSQAPCGMGGAWSEEIGRMTTGVWFLEHCASCGEFLTGVEYQPILTEALVWDRCVAWYGRITR